ncbi:MAG: PA2169 family four-helix-bundle protein [Janthinobacterium lividum]
MADGNELVKTVIQVLNDGNKGFEDIGEHIKDPQMKAFFISEAKTRGTFASQVESASGITDAGNTVPGSIHRVWGDVKAHLGGGDHTLLETAEQGEDAAKKAYQEALADTTISSSIRAILQQQQPHILESHNKVKAFRDSTK